MQFSQEFVKKNFNFFFHYTVLFFPLLFISPVISPLLFPHHSPNPNPPSIFVLQSPWRRRKSHGSSDGGEPNTDGEFGSKDGVSSLQETDRVARFFLFNGARWSSSSSSS